MANLTQAERYQMLKALGDVRLTDAICNLIDNKTSNPALQDLAMGGYKITNLGTPTEATDATTKAYVDGALPDPPAWGEITGNNAQALPSGGFTGNLELGGGADVGIIDSDAGYVDIYQYSNLSGPAVDFIRKRGTSVSPTSILSGDSLGILNYTGYGNPIQIIGASITATALENFSSTNAGTALHFYTQTTGSGAPFVERVRIATDFQLLGAGGDLNFNTAGAGINIKEGTNARMGLAALSSGSATVNTTEVTANSRIMLTHQTNAGTPGFVSVTARTPGTSFTITSSDSGDTSSIAWVILEPA